MRVMASVVCGRLFWLAEALQGTDLPARPA
jgi:hypothetical protein